ncbi:MAG TPA: hypothetical protein VKN82_00570 [Desulfohalobiaceae bacterium]|nr:hypothetical protein [Desulfohalobiaceae bacterium]
MKSDYSTKFKPVKLRSLINEGKTPREIMHILGISPHTLKEHLQLLNQRDNIEYTIKGFKDFEQEFKRIIRRRKGYICAFNSNCLPDFRFTDTFEMQESGDRVILKKVI